ncbi:MAG: glycosyltransferase family 39 protein [Polyangiales bacterium]
MSDQRATDSAASPSTSAGLRSPRAIAIAIAIVAVVASVLLFTGLGKLGLWDPHELALADLGCRQAAAAGKVELAACGSDAALKAESRPVVMIQSVAMGFRVFGLQEVAGRVPLALWIILAAAAITLAVGRLVDARAGAFAGLVTVTTPLAIVQGRLMLGDATTMGTFALALAGFAVAAFDRDGDEGAESRAFVVRGVALAVGFLGVLVGIGCRGLAVAGAPAFAVGLAALVRVANTSRKSDARAPLTTLVGAVLVAASAVAAFKLADGILDAPQVFLHRIRLVPVVAGLVGMVAMAAVGGSAGERSRRAVVGAALAMGAVCVFAGLIVALSVQTDGKFVAAIGATATASRKFPTFDLLVRQIAHGAFPWSALLPLAVGRVFAKPAADDAVAVDRESDLRVATMLAAALAFAVQTLEAPRVGLLPYAGVVALAAMIAFVLRDLERAPSASVATFLGTVALMILVLNDYVFEDLNKTPVDLATAPIIEAYGVYGVPAAETLQTALKLTIHRPSGELIAIPWMTIVGVVFLLPVLFVWVDGTPNAARTRFEETLRPIRALTAAWKHPYQSLWLLLAASFDICVAVVGWVTYKQSLRARFPQLQALSLLERKIVANLWWMVPIGVVALWCAFVAFLYVRDLFRSLRGWRVSTIAVGGLVVAVTWSFQVMPAVAGQFSPKSVFGTYRKVGRGAPVGLLAVSARTAAFELEATKPITLNDPRSAYDWLTKGDAPRKFLALRSEQLAELNHLFREKSEPRINLPVLDGRESQILLASNLPGDKSDNPLDRIVMSALPTATTACNDPAMPLCAPAHLLDCDLDGKLKCMGWDMLDDKGLSVTAVASNQKVRLRLFYQVTAKVSGAWQVFTHIEQQGTATARKTNDHVPLGGKYAMEQWLPGDIVVDDSEFNLEPNMKAGVPIKIMTGFFQGNTRLQLLSGPDEGIESDGKRLVLGTIPVR